ncbi:hypothetical protein P692DRAFT_201810086 [Suillus brevipes Sb2]|nr:hypothetical protein P692DRAFT_201810086 [Suillus brevipes Sb2]
MLLQKIKQGQFPDEFSSAPEKGEELPLEELGSALSVGHSGPLGKYTSGLVSCMIGGKMPGGFNSSAIKTHLAKNWGLGSSRADGVLLLGTASVKNRRTASKRCTKESFVPSERVPNKPAHVLVVVALLHNSFVRRSPLQPQYPQTSNLTGVYLDILHEIATSGTTFKNKNALLTGVGISRRRAQGTFHGKALYDDQARNDWLGYATIPHWLQWPNDPALSWFGHVKLDLQAYMGIYEQLKLLTR